MGHLHLQRRFEVSSSGREPVTVELTDRDVSTIQLGLRVLLASSTRHEHIYHDIRSALGKLPDSGRGQDNASACAGSNCRETPG